MHLHPSNALFKKPNELFPVASAVPIVRILPACLPVCLPHISFYVAVDAMHRTHTIWCSMLAKKRDRERERVGTSRTHSEQQPAEDVVSETGLAGRLIGEIQYSSDAPIRDSSKPRALSLILRCQQ